MRQSVQAMLENSLRNNPINGAFPWEPVTAGTGATLQAGQGPGLEEYKACQLRRFPGAVPLRVWAPDQ